MLCRVARAMLAGMLALCASFCLADSSGPNWPSYSYTAAPVNPTFPAYTNTTSAGVKTWPAYAPSAQTSNVTWPGYSTGDAASSEQGATDSNTIVQGAYGTNDAMKQNAINPFVGTGQNLYTLDGTQNGNVAMPTPSSNAFLTLSIIPSATGDLQTVLASQDLNMDGNLVGMSPFGPVAGICANGLISCTPNTFTNCKYFQWSAAPAGLLTLNQVDPTALAGCYCINNSCGSNLALLNLSTILRDIGGGAVAAAMKWNPRFTLSSASITNGSVAYYGRLTQSTSNVPGNTPSTATTPATLPGQLTMSGTGNPGVYFNSTSTLSTDANAELLAQQANPNSYYSLISNAQAARDSGISTVSCSIQRSITMSYNTNYCDEAPPGTMYRELQTTHYYRVFQGTVPTGGKLPNARPVPPSYPPGFDPTVAVPANTISADVLASMFFMHPYPMLGAWTVEDQHDPFNCDDQGLFAGHYTCFLSDEYQYYTQCIRNYDNLVEGQIDSNPSCSSLDANPQCSLINETIDNTQTRTNSMVTGIKPLPSSHTVQGSFGAYQISRPWWEIDRQYACKTNTQYNTADALTRMQSAAGTATLTTNGTSWQMSYTDTTKQPDGSWAQAGQSYVLSTVKSTSSCEKVCKVTRAGVNTQTALNGPTNALLKDVSTTYTVYKVCSPSCALNPGDTLVKDCDCIDTFPDAIAAIEALEQAKDDAICSSTSR